VLNDVRMMRGELLSGKRGDLQRFERPRGEESMGPVWTNAVEVLGSAVHTAV
jgi:hypothetical protein